MTGGINRSAVLGAMYAMVAAPLANQSERLMRSVTTTRQGLELLGSMMADGYMPPLGRRRGRGWTNAQVKRMAKKAKNRRRHKEACRR